MLYIILKCISPKLVTESSFVDEMLSQGLWLGVEQGSYLIVNSYLTFQHPFFTPF